MQSDAALRTKYWRILTFRGESLDVHELGAPLRARKGWHYKIIGDVFETRTFEELAAIFGVMAAHTDPTGPLPYKQHQFQLTTCCLEREQEFCAWLDEQAKLLEEYDGRDWGRVRVLRHHAGHLVGGLCFSGPSFQWPLPNLEIRRWTPLPQTTGKILICASNP